MIIIIAILLVVLTLPGTLQLIFLSTAALLPKRGISNNTAASDIKLAVVVPAHNEESGIVGTLQSLQACNHPLDNKHIYVVADNCSDSTASVAKELKASLIERTNEKLRGKGYALNFAFSKILTLDYDAIIVVDADTTVDDNFLDMFRNLFGSGESAGQAVYKVKNADAGIRPRLMNIAFLAFNYLRPLGRDNAGLSVGILGNGFGVSSDTLKAIPYDSFSIVEDLEYHLRLIKSGKKVRFLSNTTVWSDMPVSGSDAQSQRERWEGGRFRMLRENIPHLISHIARGQLRLIEPLFELLLLPLAFHLVLLLVLLVLGPSSFRIYALFAIVIVLAHVFIAMLIGKAKWEDWKALLRAPFYILWKVSKLGGILKTAKKGASWKRTRR